MPIPIGIPIAAMAIKGIADFFSNKSKADAEKAARVMYNEWLKDRSQTAQDIAAKLAERGIDIYGPQVTTTSASGTSSGTSQSRTVSDTSQVVDPAQAEMKALLEKIIMGKLGTPEQITEGEKAAMLERIGAGERAGLTDVTNRAAKMNLGGTSLQSAMLSNPVTSAANYQRSQYLGSEVPGQNRLLGDKSRAEAFGLMNAWKGAKNVSNTRGSTTGTFSNTGTTTAPPNYSSLLSFLAPPAPGASTQTGWNPAATAGSDLAGSLLQLWMSQQGQQKSGSSGTSGGDANTAGGWVFENGSWVWKG